jgi:hypothetical protein
MLRAVAPYVCLDAVVNRRAIDQEGRIIRRWPISDDHTLAPDLLAGGERRVVVEVHLIDAAVRQVKERGVQARTHAGAGLRERNSE